MLNQIEFGANLSRSGSPEVASPAQIRSFMSTWLIVGVLLCYPKMALAWGVDLSSINIEFEDFIDEDEVREILRESPGILVVDKREDGGYITPVECVGEYATYISRIRQDSTIENGINLWCVSDNLRKGAALNAIQIAELLGRRILKKG